MSTISIQSRSDFDSFLQTNGANTKVLLFFWASWHETSKLKGPLHDIVDALVVKFSAQKLYVLLIEAEAVPEISEDYGVSVVPTFVACVGANVVEKLEGPKPSDLAAAAKKLANMSEDEMKPYTTTKANTASAVQEIRSEAALKEKLERLIHTAPVMLFMKGSPAQPKCGFSRKIVELLQSNSIPFASFDILTDEEVRAGLKTYSDWPTFPQLYVKGALVGGLDIVKEMADAGNLKEQLNIQDLKLPSAGESSNTLEDRLKALINQAPVVLFMKGSPDQPRCGFSRQIVDILQQANVEFNSFDIFSDEEVRAGLKTYSDWPTYPQLYVHGTLVGGLDIVKEMNDAGHLKQQLLNP